MSEHKYQLKQTALFKKDLKKAIRRGCDMQLLKNIIEMLLKGETLPPSNKDHALSGNYKGNRECHITPDWLLVYRIEDDTLILSLVRTGSHSDLF